jgi:hypothetical protein
VDISPAEATTAMTIVDPTYPYLGIRWVTGAMSGTLRVIPWSGAAAYNRTPSALDVSICFGNWTTV